MQAVISLLTSHKNWLVLTGAGVSANSGVPTYRDSEGRWRRKQPVTHQEFMAELSSRQRFWLRNMVGWRFMVDAEPNPAHHILARLQQLGVVSSLVTQNVDGLHQKSGTPDDQVIELHGNAGYASCLSCGVTLALEPIKSNFLTHGTIPYCVDCGGIVKTATISFGQSMPVTEMQKAEAASLNCDLFLAIGSSLVVYPAAGFPKMAKENGARLVIINEQETDLDPFCDLVLHEQIGTSLALAAG